MSGRAGLYWVHGSFGLADPKVASQEMFTILNMKRMEKKMPLGMVLQWSWLHFSGQRTNGRRIYGSMELYFKHYR